MSKLIKTLLNGCTLSFDRGRFDDWCVFLTSPDGRRIAPRDVQYFARLQILAQKHDALKIYGHFVRIYKVTTAELNPTILEGITQLAQIHYAPDVLEMEQWFSILYAGMVAEENKAKAVLKKRIKRLGMHQVLVEGLSAEMAAQFSFGKKWRELDAIMKEKGF